jgi:GNAT superfamily N-acetyltransferase
MAVLASIRIGFEDRDRHALLYDFVQKTFGHNAPFLAWDAAEGWDRGYRSFALATESGEIVSNVSVTEMDLVLDGEKLKGFQFGALGTVPAWQGRGLSRRLIEEVIAELEPRADMILLFANDKVLDFYPRFGFRREHEMVFACDHAVAPARKAARLPLETPEGLALLKRLCRSAEPVTRRFGARGYESIFLWHALSGYFPHEVYYLPEHDSAIVAHRREQTLTIFDILTENPFDLAAVLPSLVDAPTRRIEFEFCPELWWPKALPVRPYVYAPLFVRSSRAMPIEPYKFPTMGHT